MLQWISAIAAMAGLVVSLVTLATVLIKLGRVLERADRHQGDIDMLFKWHRESVEIADERWRDVGIGLAELGGKIDAITRGQ